VSALATFGLTYLQWLGQCSDMPCVVFIAFCNAQRGGGKGEGGCSALQPHGLDAHRYRLSSHNNQTWMTDW